MNKKGNIRYVNCDNDYYYECPFCKHQHKITRENYSYHIFESGQDIQEICENCGKTLFLS